MFFLWHFFFLAASALGFFKHFLFDQLVLFFFSFGCSLFEWLINVAVAKLYLGPRLAETHMEKCNRLIHVTDLKGLSNLDHFYRMVASRNKA